MHIDTKCEEWDVSGFVGGGGGGSSMISEHFVFNEWSGGGGGGIHIDGTSHVNQQTRHAIVFRANNET